ncbi:MAG: hypothetical protein GKR90_25485 [Pseudomonadales bacterium]|nr:hypothetical protein [Pseudomonadales bacterium]
MMVYTTDRDGNLEVSDRPLTVDPDELRRDHAKLMSEGLFIAFCCEDSLAKDPTLIPLEDGTLMLNPREGSRIQIEVGNKVVQIERKVYGVNVMVRRTGSPEGPIVQSLMVGPTE